MNPMQQLVFDFVRSPRSESFHRFENFVKGSNADTVDLLQHWLTNRSYQHAYLYGSRSSGCSRLLRTSCTRVMDDGLGAALIESPLELLEGGQLHLVTEKHLLAIDNLDWLCDPSSTRQSTVEEALYELFDLARDYRCMLLFAAHNRISESRVGLRDLRTRLRSCLQLPLRPLRDEDLARLAETMLAESGVSRVPAGLGDLVLNYCRRDSTTVVECIRTMQRISLESKIPVTLTFVRNYLKRLGTIDFP